MAQRQELQSEGRRDRAESGKNMMRRARPCGGCDDSEAGKTVWGRRDRAEAGETVWRQARPCRGRRGRVEAAEQARPCGGRRDREEAGETVWIQARLPHSQVSKAFTLGRDH